MSEFIYILENPSMPGMVKIGRTEREVLTRAGELSSHTGVPTEFIIIREYAVPNSIAAEKMVHERLADYRVADNREFFRIEADDAAQIIENLLQTQRQDIRRTFDQEDALIASAMPIVLSLGTVRPRVIEERLKIPYETALFVIQALRLRGVLDEQNGLTGYWKTEHDRFLRQREIHAPLTAQVRGILAGLKDPETGEPVEIDFDYESDELGVKIRGSEWVRAEAQKRLAKFSQSYSQPAAEPAENTNEASAPICESTEPLSSPKLAPHNPMPICVAATPQVGNYQLPSLNFLQYSDASQPETRDELLDKARLIQSTLEQLDIIVALGDITKGPSFTRYELHLAPGISMDRVKKCGDNITAALDTERVNILTPVSGKTTVGVDVPNRIQTKVIMRDLLETEEWRNNKCRIPLALGNDVYGNPIIADLAEMPHLLIGGATGSGKSICVNSIITSLLYKFGPDKMRFALIDSKGIEFAPYNTLPHLLVPVVTDPQEAVQALRWVANEMEMRYRIFSQIGVLNIKSFNSRPKNNAVPPAITKQEPIEGNLVIPDYLSYVVVIIDNFQDLIKNVPEVETIIVHIAQLARASGIHLIISTQEITPSVLTEKIKTNIPTRIAFKCASRVESRTILDSIGAEQLFGNGDMLFFPCQAPRAIRAKGTFITDLEIQNILDFCNIQCGPSYELEMCKPTTGEDEELIEQCIEVIRCERKATPSVLQRRLRLGYTRSARMMNELEKRGIVGPSKGAEPRDILIDLDR